jgi:rod shape-determining protein MreC
MLKNSFDILPQTEPEFIRKDTLYRKKYIYTLAKVVNSSSNLQKNYITLNVGAKQGIEKDQAVINSLGVVAVVKDVSANFSTATSILNIDQKIISQVKKDGSYGPLAWDGKDYHYAYLTDIPTHVFLRKGDTIITSNLSDYFPEGITVGTVESYLRKQGDAFYTVKVKLSTDFKKLNYVYIVKNNYKEEKDSLEQAIKAGIK